ncbi:hypothetical protein GTS_39160 [Gandjariella thermophila]|uniref:Uncharacterized protein n=1 Tax=Gandjariella thermophila TaxID=1931992 RepID=A0A4D4JEK5_9PSEU|nr:hypothetical protein GTS_39160 [Gandjariella thermophila]
MAGHHPGAAASGEVADRPRGPEPPARPQAAHHLPAVSGQPAAEPAPTTPKQKPFAYYHTHEWYVKASAAAFWRGSNRYPEFLVLWAGSRRCRLFGDMA